MDVLLAFTGGQCLEESVTYQAIVEEGVVKGLVKGRLEGARHSLLLLGEELFKTPAGPHERATIEAISSPEQLDQLTRRAPRVQSWEELLVDVPSSEARRGRGKRG